jgi:hypothetical protein
MNYRRRYYINRFAFCDPKGRVLGRDKPISDKITAVRCFLAVSNGKHLLDKAPCGAYTL